MGARRQRKRYERWERAVAGTLHEINPRAAELFLACPLPYSRERIQAQVALMEGVMAKLNGSTDPAAVYAEHLPDLERFGL